MTRMPMRKQKRTHVEMRNLTMILPMKIMMPTKMFLGMVCWQMSFLSA
jgi:hypothetical protein